MQSLLNLSRILASCPYSSDRYNWRIYNKNAKGKNLEPSTTELLKHLLKRSDLFVDIGANIDYYSLLAVSILGTSGKVYSFEPSQQTYNRLRENITLNSFSTLSHTRWQFLTNLLQLNYTQMKFHFGTILLVGLPQNVFIILR